jgi:hypothetical protein
MGTCEAGDPDVDELERRLLRMIATRIRQREALRMARAGPDVSATAMGEEAA